MSIDSSMDKMLQRRQEVEAQLSRSAELSNKQLADFSRELSELRPVCDQIELVRQLEGELEDALTMVVEAASDVEIQAMAEAEVTLLKDKIPAEKEQLQLLLLPKDKDDSRNAILEVRAGTGGDELAENNVQLRNLADGTQSEIMMDDLAEVVAAALLAP